ncbi:MAG: hypothetical protein GXO39_05765 [Thermotogae bacterium]|nr:hypothetical protein [Thermotogota bacterium]
MNKGGTVRIFWEKVHLSDLDEVEDTYFYAIFRDKNLLYIGMAYYQDIAREVKNTIRDFDMDTAGLYLCLGYITSTTYGRITLQIIRDVECALINALQPLYNTQCTSSYTGRSGLEIYNRGCIRGKIET